MNYATLDDDALRLEVARRLGWQSFKGDEVGLWWTQNPKIGWVGGGNFESGPPFPDYPRDTLAALSLLDNAKYPDGVSVEYNIGKLTRYSSRANLLPPGSPEYIVIIWGKNPKEGHDYEATADTLARAACEAWLMWDDAMD